MKFGRYAAYVRKMYLFGGIYILFASCVLIMPTVKDKFWGVLFGVLLGYLLLMPLWYFLIRRSAKDRGGRLSDRVVFSDDGIELHTREGVTSIDWFEIVEVRPMIPSQVMRELKVIARDGTVITFASSRGIEKYIWEKRPELKKRS